MSSKDQPLTFRKEGGPLPESLVDYVCVLGASEVLRDAGVSEQRISRAQRRLARETGPSPRGRIVAFRGVER